MDLKSRILAEFNDRLQYAMSEQELIMRKVTKGLAVFVTWFRKHHRYIFSVEKKAAMLKKSYRYDLKFLGGRWKLVDPNSSKE